MGLYEEGDSLKITEYMVLYSNSNIMWARKILNALIHMNVKILKKHFCLAKKPSTKGVYCMTHFW